MMTSGTRHLSGDERHGQGSGPSSDGRPSAMSEGTHLGGVEFSVCGVCGCPVTTIVTPGAAARATRGCMRCQVRGLSGPCPA